MFQSTNFYNQKHHKNMPLPNTSLILAELARKALDNHKPTDAIKLVLDTLKEAIPFEACLFLAVDRSSKTAQTFIGYTGRSDVQIKTNRKLKRVSHWDTVRGLMGADLRSIIVVDDLRFLPEERSTYKELGFNAESTISFIPYYDLERNLLLTANFLSSKRGAFAGPLCREAIEAFRGIIESLTVSFFYSDPSPSVIMAGDSIISLSAERQLRRCPDLLDMMDLVDAVAPMDTTVLIHGPTGSGKELVAEALHSLSSRSKGPLVKVNCSAIPESLVESELFGYEKGAFTGATSRHKGYFEQANHGTLYLDEVGELTAAVQARLLRVLENNEIRRIGSETPAYVDVRVIAGTHRDLEKMVAEGTFREDLYYRLGVFELEVPPLERRRRDIPLLARDFHAFFAAKLNKKSPPFTDKAAAQLVERKWPGNVRQLKKVMEQELILCAARGKTELDFSAGPRDASNSYYAPPPHTPEQIAEALEQCRGKIQGKDGAAALLGLSPSTLRNRMNAFGIPLPRARSGKKPRQTIGDTPTKRMGKASPTGNT